MAPLTNLPGLLLHGPHDGCVLVGLYGQKFFAGIDDDKIEMQGARPLWRDRQAPGAVGILFVGAAIEPVVAATNRGRNGVFRSVPRRGSGQ